MLPTSPCRRLVFRASLKKNVKNNLKNVRTVNVEINVFTPNFFFVDLTIAVGGVGGRWLGGQKLASAKQLVLDNRSLVEQLPSQHPSLLLKIKGHFVNISRERIKGRLYGENEELTCCRRMVSSSPPIGPRLVSSSSFFTTQSTSSLE